MNVCLIHHQMYSERCSSCVPYKVTSSSSTAVRDSEESAEYSYPIEKMLWFKPEDLEAHESKILQAERTRIIKALEGLKRPMHSGLDSVTFHQNDGFNTGIRQAIKAVGESAGKETND